MISLTQKLRFIMENEKPLFKIAVGVSVIWIITQIVLIICFWGHPQISDMGYYISMAERCFKNGEWYPMAEDVYSRWIVCPGFINYLILQLNIFGTINYNALLNLFMNIAMLFEIYYLGRKFFSERTGLIAVIIFCLLYSNLLIVLGANTENSFLFLCLSALCLVFSGKWQYVILAALLFALANWIRPMAIIFLFASVYYFIVSKTKYYNYPALIIPYILVLVLIGAVTEKKVGHFVYQSSTSGYNLLTTSNDKAKGIHYLISEDPVSFIEDYDHVTFAEKDSIWTARSIKWIKENPAKFALLYIKKIPLLYIHDSWAHYSHWSVMESTHFLTTGEGPENAKAIFIKKFLKQVLQSIPYYIAFFFFLYALWKNRKEISAVKLVFLTIFIIGTLITCIFPASPRYHYPFIFVIIIYGAWGIDTRFRPSPSSSHYIQRKRNTT